MAGFLWATLGGRGPQGAVDAGTAVVGGAEVLDVGDMALVDVRDVEDLAGRRTRRPALTPTALSRRTSGDAIIARRLIRFGQG